MSSKSNLEYAREIPPVLSVFLVKFDNRKGNTIVWSKSVPGKGDVLQRGLEFRAMPSGLHSVQSDVIYLVQPRRAGNNGLELLEGLAVFCQKKDNPLATDRNGIEMFSLGILCDWADSTSATTHCWVYVDALKDLLEQFVEQRSYTGNRYDLFDKFFDSFHKEQSSDKLETNTNNHPILSLRRLLSYYGPLVFEVWKAAILRSRVLLINNNLSVEECCKFLHILSILATFPSDITHLVTEGKIKQLGNINSLYSVTLPDITWLSSEQMTDSAFLATTKDNVLLEKSGLYDFALVTDISTENTHLRTSTGRYVYSTARDHRRFNALSNALGLPHTASHDTTSFRDHYGACIGSCLDGMASVCSHSSINGFLWWASAGEQSTSETLQDDLEGFPLLQENDNDAEEPSAGDSIVNSEGPSSSALHKNYSLDSSCPLEITAIGYFHQMTRRLFRTCVAIIQDQDYDNGGTPVQNISLELSDIANMGLDAYSTQDREFAVQFMRVWWNRDVKINQQLLNICCQ